MSNFYYQQQLFILPSFKLWSCTLKTQGKVSVFKCDVFPCFFWRCNIRLKVVRLTALLRRVICPQKRLRSWHLSPERGKHTHTITHTHANWLLSGPAKRITFYFSRRRWYKHNNNNNNSPLYFSQFPTNKYLNSTGQTTTFPNVFVWGKNRNSIWGKTY